MNKYAVVKNGTVINIIVWDGITEWAPEDGKAIQVSENIGIGWSYAKGEFTAPPAPEVTREQMVAQAEIQKSVLMQKATSKISVLQDAVDYKMATAEETASLTDWTKYRVLLNRIDTSTAPAITWPEQP